YVVYIYVLYLSSYFVHLVLSLFHDSIQLTLKSTLFPYTTLFRSRRNGTFLEILTTELPAFQEEVSDPFKNAVRNALKKAKVQPSIGALSGRIANYGSTSSPMGKLAKVFS